MSKLKIKMSYLYLLLSFLFLCFLFTGSAAAGSHEAEIQSSGTPIRGQPRVSVTEAQKWAVGRGAHQRFISIAPTYWYYGRQTGIRPEVLYAQSAKETNFGKYTGVVPPHFNNWAGIKTRQGGPCNDPNAHERFSTPQEGVRAHFNHMCAYVGIKPVGNPHGRYHIVKSLSWAGTVKTVEELGGKWAPSSSYGRSIVNDYLRPILNRKDKFSAGDWVRSSYKGTANFRSAPGLNAKVITTIPYRTVGRIISHSKNGTLASNHIWWYMELFEDGRRGWVAQSLLESTKTPKSTIFATGEWVRTTHTGATNFRSGPDLNTRVITGLPYRTVGRVISHKDNGIFAAEHFWWYMELFEDGRRGWISQSLLEPTKAPTSKAFSAGNWIRSSYNAGRANLRDGPGLDAKVITTIPYHAVGRVISHKDNGIFAAEHFWWHVELHEDNRKGWIAESLLEATAAPPASVSVSIEPETLLEEGAGWRLASGPDTEWKQSGDYIHDLPPDKTYKINFKPVAGWLEPDDKVISVKAGQNLHKTGIYQREDCVVEEPPPPSGAGYGLPGHGYTYSVEEQFCQAGHEVEYRFDWGDGTYSAWSSSRTASHQWDEGVYPVRAQVRCTDDNSTVSPWSDPREVNIGLAYGDIDGDGWVSINDAILILRHSVGLIDLEANYGPESLDRARVNGGKGVPDLADALLILRRVTGLINAFPAENH